MFERGENITFKLASNRYRNAVNGGSRQLPPSHHLDTGLQNV
jgi:hypothetical protein